MRIFSGSARGRFVNGPKGVDLRPTTDRTRLALFNALGALVPDCTFLDLFCGSGSVGLEALSRGARRVSFVDSNKLCLDAVRASAEAFGFNSGSYELLQGDYQRGLNALATRRVEVDLAFVDPPYDAGLGGHALKLLLDLKLIRPGGRIILEHSSAQEAPQVPGLALYKQYDHGAAMLSVYGVEEAQLAG
jgi:16S rRNA (guanine(966)-N(2))-methyltransferase RsmD